MEDSLKHLYHCQEVGQPASLDSLAGALEVPRNVAVRLATGLERHKLAEIVGGQLKLTESGQRYAAADHSDASTLGTVLGGADRR